METRIMVTGVVSWDDIAANVSALVRDVATQMKCREELPHKVIVADADHFGAAITELSPGTPYTNNEDYAAVAKVLPFKKPDGSEGVGVVFRDFVVTGAFDALNKTPSERSPDEQRFIYVLFHEMAHVRDHAERPVREPAINAVSDPSGRFKIEHVAAFFLPVVIDEVIACYFSALACSQAMFDGELADTNKVIERQLAALAVEVAGYSGGQGILRKIAFDSSSAFWVAFVQYGKLIAHFKGGRHLAPAFQLWKDAPTGAEDVIRDYAALLDELFKMYPVIPADFADKLLALWERMAALNGFSFLEHPWSGDGVAWR